MSYKLTPIMQQYKKLKAENQDCVLLFRLGDFYEIFFEDAIIISKVLGLVLTSKGKDENNKPIAMCGIPWHTIENYLPKLVKKNFKIAIAEQIETPEEAKLRGHKYIERKIIRILTPGTLTDDNLLTSIKSNFLLSINMSKQNEFDLAGCDISTGEFFIGQTKDLLTDIFTLNPAEIIYKEEIAEIEIIKTIRNLFKTTPINNRLYKRADIDKIIKKYFNDINATNSIIMLAAYLFNTQRDSNLIFKKPYVYNEKKQLLIDSSTWKNLEIDSVLNEGGICLFDILNYTKTPFGARRLHFLLRSLSSDINEIETRQNHIKHLTNNIDLLTKLQNLLNNVPDVERSIQRLLVGRAFPRDLKNILNFLLILPKFKQLALLLDNEFSKQVQNLNSNEELAKKLNSALKEELPVFFRDGGLIKQFFNKDLDNLKKLSANTKKIIADLQLEYSKITDTTLKIKYNNILGYFIEISSNKADALFNNDLFIHRQTLSGVTRFTTTKLIDLDNNIKNASDKILALELEIIDDFIKEIKDKHETIIEAINLMANIDVYLSLAYCAHIYLWVCPKLTTNKCFEVKGGRHPVIEYALKQQGNYFIKNDCILNKQKIAILTGPNMAGKSTYLRQNAIIVILAHLGSFVPADSATIGLCDQLFSRVGASDNLATGQSTFMLEMVETANILNKATSESFIILDEIGRGTATFDGMAIAQAILEYLNTLNTRTLFATHYHELTKISSNLINTQCLTSEIKNYNGDVIFMHKIVNGVANKSYGIFVAKLAGIPISITNRAEQILQDLETTNKNTEQKLIIKKSEQEETTENIEQLTLF